MGGIVAVGIAGVRHKAHRRATVSNLLLSSAAVAIAIVAAVLFTGGSFALWATSAPITLGSVTTGSMQLRVNSSSTVALSGATWSTLLPGDVVSQQVTLQNIGSVSTTVTASTTGSFGSLVVHTKKGVCSSTITGTSSTVSPTALGVFAAGESAVACIQVSLPVTASNSQQGTAQTFTVTFTGTTGS